MVLLLRHAPRCPGFFRERARLLCSLHHLLAVLSSVLTVLLWRQLLSVPQALGFVLDVAFVGQLSRAGDWTVWSRRGCGSVGSRARRAQLCPSAGVLPGHVPASWGAGGRRPGFCASPPGVLSAAGWPPPTLGRAGPLGRCRAGCGDVGEENGSERVCPFLVTPVTSSCCLWPRYVFTLKKEGHTERL